MVLAQLGTQKLRVYLENQDGMIYSGDVYVAELSTYGRAAMWGVDRCVWDEPLSWEMTLTGVGDLTLTNGDTWLAKQRRAVEWRCAFCGLVNLIGARKCEGCNASRPFILTAIRGVGE